MATFENEDRSVVEFQLGNKQLFLLFIGLLIICAIFFFIGLRVGEDTVKSKGVLSLSDNGADQAANPANQSAGTTMNIRAGASQQDLTASRRLDSTSDTPAFSGELRASEQDLGAVTPDVTKMEDKPRRGNSTLAKSVEMPVEKTAQVKENFATVLSKRYYVQVTAQTNVTGAEKTRGRIAPAYKTIIEKVVVNEKNYFRVLIGPFATKEKAQEAHKSVNSEFKEAFVKYVK